MQNHNSKLKISDNKGFASFEFAWGSLVFVLLLMVFFQFFKMFQHSEQTLIESAHKAFSIVGKTIALPNYGVVAPGLVSKNEVIAMGGCVLDCKSYMAPGPIDTYNFGAGGMVYQPRHETYLILEDPEN